MCSGEMGGQLSQRVFRKINVHAHKIYYVAILTLIYLKYINIGFSLT